MLSNKIKTATITLIAIITSSTAHAQRQPWLMGDDLSSMVFVYNDIANNQYWLVDIDGNQISKTQPFMEKVRNESRVAIFKNKSGKYGVIGAKGEEIIPAQYDNARIFAGPDKDKDARIALTKKNKTGLFDENGNKLIDFIYTDIDGTYADGALYTTIGDKKGVINTANLKEILAPDKYDNIRLLNGKYLLAQIKGKYGIVDFNTGTTVAPFEFTEADVHDSPLAWSNDDNYSCSILLKGPDGYYMFHEGKLTFVSNVGDISITDNGIAQVHHEGGLYYVDDNGEVTRDDHGLMTIIPTKAGTRVFENVKGKTTGMKMSDVHGNTLLDPANGLTDPEWIDDLQMFRMKKGNKIAFISPTGKIMIPALYTASDNNRRGAIEYTHSILVVNKNGKCGVIDKNNKVIIPFNYKLILPSVDPNGEIDNYKVYANGKWGVLSPTGKTIIAPKGSPILDYDFKYIEKPYDGGKYMIENKKTKSFDIFDSNGKILGNSKMTKWWAIDNDPTVNIVDFYQDWTPEEKANEFFITYNRYYKSIKQ